MWRRDPVDVDLVLKALLYTLEVKRKMQRENEGEQRDHEGGPLQGLVIAWHDHQRQRACCGNEGDERENDCVHYRSPAQTM